MLRNKVTEKIQEIKTDYTPNRISPASILSSFKALRLAKGFSEFNKFNHCGYGFDLILSFLITIVVSAEKNAGVRQGKWKLAHKSPQNLKDKNQPTPYNEWELYDMENDRTEIHDLSDANPELVKKLADI